MSDHHADPLRAPARLGLSALHFHISPATIDLAAGARTKLRLVPLRLFLRRGFQRIIGLRLCDLPCRPGAFYVRIAFDCRLPADRPARTAPTSPAYWLLHAGGFRRTDRDIFIAASASGWLLYPYVRVDFTPLATQLISSRLVRRRSFGATGLGAAARSRQARNPDHASAVRVSMCRHGDGLLLL